MIPQAPMVESRPLSESEWSLLNAGVNPPGVDIVLVVGYGFRAKVGA